MFFTAATNTVANCCDNPVREVANSFPWMKTGPAAALIIRPVNSVILYSHYQG
jgi:hypothetical protein